MFNVAVLVNNTALVNVVDPVERLDPLIVIVPVDADIVKHVAVDEATFDVTLNAFGIENPPPTAAVPPPTNVPALDALVMRFTLTLVSIVTVNPFA